MWLSNELMNSSIVGPSCASIRRLKIIPCVFTKACSVGGSLDCWWEFGAITGSKSVIMLSRAGTKGIATDSDLL